MNAVKSIHPNARLPPGADGTTIILSTRYSGYVGILLGIWLLAWGIVEASLIGNLASDLRQTTPVPDKSVALLVTLMICFAGAGAFMAWRLIWILRGREILSVTPERLTLNREPTPGSSVEYDRSQIRELHVGTYDPDRIYPSWGRRFLGTGTSFVGFEYHGKSCQIARGISRSDAQSVLHLLRG